MRPAAFAIPISWEPMARDRLGSIGLDCNLESRPVERIEQRLIELQQRLAAGAYYKGPVGAVIRPSR
jgi:hypothetical protein